MNRRTFHLGLAGLALLLLTGCLSDRTDDPESGKSGPKSETDVVETLSEAAHKTRNTWARKPRKYAPLKNYDLELYATSRREFATGQDAELVFALRNNDRKPIRIEDWKIQQSDNVRLFIQNWFPDTENPDEAAWIPLNDDPAQPDLRYPLDLMPGNQALISKPLPFVRDLEVSPGAERRYFVKAELTLDTVKVATEVFGIAIHRGKAE